MMAEQVAKKLPQKALTQGVIYPMVKKVAGYIGVQMMTKPTPRVVDVEVIVDEHDEAVVTGNAEQPDRR